MSSNSSKISSTLPNCSRWVIMRDPPLVEPEERNEYLRTPLLLSLHKVLYFCGEVFQPKLFEGWKCFVETI